MKLTVIADFDGCTGTLEARERLIKQLIEDLKQNPDIDHVDIMIGSARGLNFCHDFRSSYQHSLRGAPHKSCSILGDEFIEQLSTAVMQDDVLVDRVNVTFDNMLLGDVLNDLSIGATFALMQAHRELYSFWAQGKFSFGVGENKLHHILIRPKKLLEPSNDLIDFSTNSLEVHDEYKLLMIYTIMQYQKLRYPLEQKNKFIFLDDRVDILQAVDDFYFEFRTSLVPDQCELEVKQFCVASHRCDEFSPRKTDDVIVGSGQANYNYAATVRDIAAVHNSYVEELDGRERTAKNLNDALSDIILDKHSKAIDAIKPRLKRTVTFFNLDASPPSVVDFAKRACLGK